MTQAPAPSHHDPDRPSRALVLGGGGIAGIAWQSGLLAGLLHVGLDLNAADLVVGTSAGSVVAVLLRAGRLTPETLTAYLEGDAVAEAVEHTATDDEQGQREDMAFDGLTFMAMMQEAAQGDGTHQQARARIGKRALDATVSTPENVWVDRIASRLPADWPTGALGVTTVDAHDGSFHVFGADSGVELARAVAASCTVPTVFPLVSIDGRRYMDGGMRSATNADVATGHDRVLAVACFPEAPASSFGPALDRALATLGTKRRAMLVVADEASQRAFGTNVLDPASQAPSFAAGWAQAEDVAGQVRRLWEE